MSVVARRFAAVPARLSSDAWKAITALVCQNNAASEAEFSKVAGVASCLLNDKTFQAAPFVVKNEGPRLKVYCLYGDDALGGEDVDEEKLTWQPTHKTWSAFLPCHHDDLPEFAAELKRISNKFFAYDMEKGLNDEVEKTDARQNSAAVAVDWEAFKKL